MQSDSSSIANMIHYTVADLLLADRWPELAEAVARFESRYALREDIHYERRVQAVRERLDAILEAGLPRTLREHLEAAADPSNPQQCRDGRLREARSEWIAFLHNILFWLPNEEVRRIILDGDTVKNPLGGAEGQS